MGINTEAEQKKSNALSSKTPYLTVRESIDQELEAIQRSGRDGDIYEIHRRFEEFANHHKTSNTIVNVGFGSLVFVVFLLLYPFIALGIKLSSRGSVIYKQKRTGQSGREFVCYKFRTMHQIDLRRIDGKPTVTRSGDKRVFDFGNFLRRTSLDELPQIINILKGEMSLIGPRPYPVQECAYWNTKFDDFYYRYAMKPGITGLAQINGFRGGTLDEQHMRKRLDYDLTYIRGASMKLDMHIIRKTFGKVLYPDQNAH